MKNESKHYCINGLVSMVVSDYLAKDFPNKTNVELLTMFLSSRTYELMCNLDTRLWAEGPLYIYETYKIEH